MELSEQIQRAELERLEAEKRKLQLEAEEIERRINAPWWRGTRFLQYATAVVITAGILFAWARIYVEPILAKDLEIADRKTTLNRLEHEAFKREQAIQTRDLKRKRDRLEQQIATLNGAIDGVNYAVELVASGQDTYFSLVNKFDRINRLRQFGWEIGSDDYFHELGYYLVATHPGLRAGGQIIVTREANVDDLKKAHPRRWRRVMRERTEHHHDQAPVIALDYSYFGLIKDRGSPVGGTLYTFDGNELKFYAPLANWDARLAELLDRQSL